MIIVYSYNWWWWYFYAFQVRSLEGSVKHVVKLMHI